MEANKSGIIEYTTAASTTSTISILVRIIVQCLYKMKKKWYKFLQHFLDNNQLVHFGFCINFFIFDQAQTLNHHMVTFKV